MRAKGGDSSELTLDTLSRAPPPDPLPQPARLAKRMSEKEKKQSNRPNDVPTLGRGEECRTIGMSLIECSKGIADRSFGLDIVKVIRSLPPNQRR
jgi:hypothetical protein